MQKISACVITNNDEHIVEWSVSSVRWVDEIVVVDTGSTDRTVEIAQSLGARVVHSEPFSGFGRMRNRALEYCSHDWVFSLDADEHCTQTVRHGIWAFLRMYIFRYGFVDGWPGFIIALSNFEGTFYRYAKCYERMRAFGPPSEDTAPRRNA